MIGKKIQYHYNKNEYCGIILDKITELHFDTKMFSDYSKGSGHSETVYAFGAVTKYLVRIDKEFGNAIHAISPSSIINILE